MNKPDEDFNKKGSEERRRGSLNCVGNNLTGLATENSSDDEIKPFAALQMLISKVFSISKLLHITEAVQLFGLPKAKFYQAINSGALRYFQFEGNAKKYLMLSDIQDWILHHAVEIPQESDSFNAFEQELRKQLKRGDELAAKLKAHTGNSPPSNPSELATALWDCGVRTKELKNLQLSTNSRKAFK